jgi:hypothetical protein
LAPCDFSASPIKAKTKRPPFWHNWGDRGRIAGCAEHPHRTRLPGCILKNGRSAGNGVYTRKGTTSRVMVASRHKVCFLLDGSTSPRNYGYECVCVYIYIYIYIYIYTQSQSLIQFFLRDSIEYMSPSPHLKTKRFNFRNAEFSNYLEFRTIEKVHKSRASES